MSNKLKETSSCASGAGFQAPVANKELEEFFKENSDLTEQDFIFYLSRIDEGKFKLVEKILLSGAYKSLGNDVRESIIKEMVQKKVDEVIRKSNSGGYNFYAPNKGKKGKAKTIQHYPTLIAAKQASLVREKDPEKRAEIEKQIRSLKKHPSKGLNVKLAKPKPKEEPVVAAKTESIASLIGVANRLVQEALFKEEEGGSQWENQIDSFSKNAIKSDKKLFNLQKNIEKKTEVVLADAFNLIKKAVGKIAKLTPKGIQLNETGKRIFVFSAEVDGVKIEPILIYVNNGLPKVELSDEARNYLSSVETDDGELFLGKLTTVQHKDLDKLDSVVSAIEVRDKYLDKCKAKLDDYASQLTPVELALFKKLLNTTKLKQV